MWNVFAILRTFDERPLLLNHFGTNLLTRMSTFKGIVKGNELSIIIVLNGANSLPEFPQIRIDYFRRVGDEAPPLACFLSHVHSDHLQGLESLKSPFVYCSPATREVGSHWKTWRGCWLLTFPRSFSGWKNTPIA